MKYLLGVVIGLLLVLAHNATAGDNGIVSLREVSVDYKRFFPKGRDPLITGNGLLNRELGNEVNVHINSDFMSYFYWDNMVHSLTDRDATTHTGGQFRVVGWNFKLGMRVSRFINIQYEHFSKHTLDHSYAYDSFPVQDSVGVKLYLYGGPKKEGLVW